MTVNGTTEQQNNGERTRKFRCPYCRKTFGPEPQSMCPYCHKTMMIPDRVLGMTHRERKKLKQRIQREAARERARLRIPDSSFARKPSVLLLILGVMAFAGAMLVGRMTKVSKPQTNNAKLTTTTRNLDRLRVAVERFRRDCNRYPRTAEGLRALVRDPGADGWQGPYVNMVRPDSWERPFHYSFTNGTLNLFSLGQDGVAENGDDILSAEPSEEMVNLDITRGGRGPGAGVTEGREIMVPVNIRPRPGMRRPKDGKDVTFDGRDKMDRVHGALPEKAGE